MKRTETYRTLQTVQRIGEDLPETVLQFDAATKRLSLGGSRERCEAANMAEAIVAALDGKTATEALTEPEIGDAVEGKTTLKRKALRDLTRQGKIVRLGTGKRGDPFRYVSCFLVPDPMKISGNNNLPYRSADAIFEEPEKVVPDFHTHMGNKGTREQAMKTAPKVAQALRKRLFPAKPDFTHSPKRTGTSYLRSERTWTPGQVRTTFFNSLSNGNSMGSAAVTARPGSRLAPNRSGRSGGRPGRELSSKLPPGLW
jgi:hypothetical protein